MTDYGVSPDFTIQKSELFFHLRLDSGFLHSGKSREISMNALQLGGFHLCRILHDFYMDGSTAYYG